MSQQNLPNGMLPQMNDIRQSMLPAQGPIKQHFNGKNSSRSSQSSRDHSPVTCVGQIPISQLPPRHTNLLTSQSRPSPARSSDVTLVTQQISHLGVNPSNTKFGTSTPNDSINQGVSSNVTDSFVPNSAFSPITSLDNRSQQVIETSKTLIGSVSSSRVQSLSNLGNNQQDTTTIPSVISQNKGQNVNTTCSVNSQQNQQSGVNRITEERSFQQIPLTQSNFRSNIMNINHNLPYTSQKKTAPQNIGFQNQNFTSPVSEQSGTQMPKQNAFLNGPPRLVTSTSQPKLLPPTLSQQNISQIGTSQSTGNSAPNLYQAVHQASTPQSLSNKLLQNYQVPHPSLESSNVPIQPIKTTTPNHQRPSLFNNRYPSVTAFQQPNQVTGVNSQQQSVSNEQIQGYNQQTQAYNQQAQPYNQQAQPYNQQAQIYNQKPLYPQQQMFPSPQQQKPLQTTPFSQPNYPGYQPTVASVGFNKLWGNEIHDLLQNPNILPPTSIQPPKVSLGQDTLNNANCSSEVFRCTMTKIPENNSLLQKSRLPLGILIHPFKDLLHLPVVQCAVIVRCRACRTYINPFVYFVDNKRWKCNLCFRVNELPEEFQFDPISKTYGDPSRRPEVRASTIEYIAPSEYMLRPPQPAVYLFLLDISRAAIECGYLQTVCSVLLEELKNLPGDARTKIGFLAYDSALHFFSLAEDLSQPHEMIILDIDDVFLPCPDNLLVNLKDRMELVADLLNQLPTRYLKSFDNNSALGAALKVAHEMMSATGGRVTVFQSSLPNVGPGALTAREIPSQRSSVEVAQLNPANDFYKRLSLECSALQIAVDIFTVNSQFVDLSTISGISRFSGGCMYHFPLFKVEREIHSQHLERCFKRYLTRKIGFEAVMRIRCTRGLSIHTFHGNFFVRSTDLLSLPNINPDSGYGMQVAIDESLSELQTVCLQAALLYTSSKGERRIRVHTLCLPVASTLHDVIHSADQQCIVGLLAKMAVDRSMQSSLSDAREAFINVAIDILSSYKMSLNLGSPQSGLLAPECLKLLPLYISALLKNIAFRIGTPTRLDDRIKAMMDMKTKPLCHLMQQIYPDLYPINNLEEQQVVLNTEEEPVPLPPHIQLTARCLDHKGAYLMDTGEHLIIYVCSGVSETFLNHVLGVPSFTSIPEELYDLPILENPHSKRLHQFISYLNDDKPFTATLQIIRDNSSFRLVFLEKLIEDRLENALSYHEFLQHLKSQVK